MRVPRATWPMMWGAATLLLPASAVASPDDARAVPSAPAPAPLACLARSYAGTPARKDDGWTLKLADGTAIPYENGAFVTSATYAWPTVKDVYEMRYRTGAIVPITEPSWDPGRVRIESLLRATYGASADAVQKSLVSVPMRGRTFRVHTRIEAPFRRVATRLDAAAKTPEGRGIDRFFTRPGGTFNWRFIAGTRELSMHAWGIAIDLDPSVGDYWRNVPEATRAWKNRLPQAIVDAFEAEGFIWGGRWFHFDTMHFEYRPELLDPACYPTPTTTPIP